MSEKLRDISIPAGYLIFILFLSFAVINTFFLPQKYYLMFNLKDYLKAAVFIFLSITFVIAEWVIISRSFKQAGNQRFLYTAIALSPIAMLFFWNPRLARPTIIFPIAIILFTQFWFWEILSNKKIFFNFFQKQKKIIYFFLGLYIVIFVGISIQ